MHWRFNSTIGTFTIVKDGEHADLYLGDALLGRFTDPAGAARSVAQRETGHAEWDSISAATPADIEQWCENGS